MAKFATNTSGAMLLPNSIQVMESISGSVVPLAMFSKLVTIERVWWVTMERGWWVTMNVRVERVWWVTNSNPSHTLILWSLKNGLLWHMSHTSMSQFHTEWSHFLRLMVPIDFDGVSTHLMIILMIDIWIIRAYMGYIPISYGVVPLFKAMVTID